MVGGISLVNKSITTHNHWISLDYIIGSCWIILDLNSSWVHARSQLFAAVIIIFASARAVAITFVYPKKHICLRAFKG
jgi:hypothetical protein